MWNVIETVDGELHCVPANDLQPHSHTRDCWCQPFSDDGVICHNSADGREHSEGTKH